METSQDSPTEYARIVDRERREIETPLALAVVDRFETAINGIAEMDDPAAEAQSSIESDNNRGVGFGLPDLLARGMFAAYKAGHRRAGLAVGLPESDPFFSAVGDWPELELAGEKGLARRFLKIAKDTAKKAGKAVGDAIRSLVKRLKGEKPTSDQIKEAVKAAGYLQYDSASVLKTIVETAIPAAYAEGQGAGFFGNPGKTILGFQFVAVLDERTTKYCRPLDGVKLPVSDPWLKKNEPPRHYRCRSVLAPLTAPFVPTPNPPNVAPQAGFIRLSGDKIMPDEMNMPSPVLMLDAKGLAPAIEIGEPEYEEIPTDEVIGHEGGKPVFKMTQVPIRTFLKEAARVGDWYHRGDGELVQLTKSRLKEWHDNYAKLADAGVTPWVPDYHEFSRSNAAINNGRVTGVELDASGDSLKAKVRLVGSKAIQKMLTNDVSVGIALDPRTAHGPDPFAGEYLHHLALTPNPALPNLSPWARLAASADGTLVEPPKMYEMRVADSADGPTNTPSSQAAVLETDMKLTPEQKAKLGKIAADAPEDVTPDYLLDLIEGKAKEAEKSVALSGDVDRLTAELKTANSEKDAKAQEVVSLSASSRVDPLAAETYGGLVETQLEDATSKGLPEAFVNGFRELLQSQDGKSNVLALSACKGKGKDGKVKDSRLGIEVGKLLVNLASSGYGQGVPTGAARAVLQASGDDATAASDADVKAAREAYDLPKKP